MYGMMRKIARKFEQEGIRYEMRDGDQGEKLILFSNRIKDTSISLTYIIIPGINNNDYGPQNIHIRSGDICHVNSPMVSTYRCLNKLNHEFNFIKFIINSEDSIQIHADAIVPYDSSEDSLWELLVGMVSILDIAYPQLMKAVWN